MAGEQARMDFYDSGFGYDSSGAHNQQGAYNSQQNYSFQQYGNPSPAPGSSNQGPTMMNPGQNFYGSPNVGNQDYTNFDDEPPLLEELGINFDHIWQKTLSVLNPLKQPDATIMDDTDLAGPLVFCVAFGGLLLLSGKVYGFGYIYGVGVLGCLCMYAVLNLMSLTGVTLSCVVSILGYCLLPMVLLSAISVIFTLKASLGTILTCLIIAWCSASASKLFVTVLAMDSQQPLVAYPCALVYGVFALLTVF